MFGEEVVGAQRVGAGARSSRRELFELRVQRDVAVVVELADRDPQPERRADLHDSVDGEVEQLASANPGAGQELDDEA